VPSARTDGAATSASHAPQNIECRNGREIIRLPPEN